MVKNPMNLQFCVPLSLAVMLLAAVPSRAQEQREGDGELFVLTGGTAGGIGAHPIITGGAGASFTRYLIGTLEASVIPMNDETLLPTAAVRVHGSDLFDFNFALQGVVPIRKWEPYGTFGLAVLMNSFTGEFPQPSGIVASVGQRHSKFGLEAGAGVRYYVSEKWGVRAEYRYTSSVPNFNRVLGGVFYRVQGTSVFGFLPALARRFR